MILVLALGAPGGSRSGNRAALGPAMLSARGPLLQIDQHPEWRQFLILAALQRADELAHLRELADEPLRDSAQDRAVQFAVLPAERSDAEPEDVTGTINVAPTIPIEIGETSSMELPVIAPEERLPVVKPGQVKSKIEIKKKIVRRFSRAKPPAKPEPAPLNIFEAIFGVSPSRQASTATPPANQPATPR